MSSTTLRSSSVSSPASTRSIGLPDFLLRSRTRRAIFWNVWRIGTMRIDIALRCRSLVMRLQLREVAREPLVGEPDQRRVGVDDRLHDHQLADHVDEVVELARVHLDRRASAGPRRRAVQVPPGGAPPGAGSAARGGALVAPADRCDLRRWRRGPGPASATGVTSAACGRCRRAAGDRWGGGAEPARRRAGLQRSARPSPSARPSTARTSTGGLPASAASGR